MNRAESKMGERAIYQPGASSVEGLPTALQMFHNHPPIMAMPHWHAQVEVNYIMRGSVHYRMNEHDIRLNAGDMCLFWGGQPHQMTESSDDAIYAGAHLPLVHFFRMRLPENVPSQLMQGAILVTSATDGADNENFARWYRYARSGDPAKAEHAVNELLLRIERVGFDPYQMVAHGRNAASAEVSNQQSSRLVARICDFIAGNFLHDIGSIDIAASAGVHPKYAMNVFKKSTGMTLNNYVSLLRLSYAQAMLLREEANVLQVAMDSGFGSLSAFNKSFRNIAGMSPSDFRRDMRSGGQLTSGIIGA
ncbi:helix-turn-helix domain-containing protein (plasmid) [Phyllobacterium sp. 628]|uniref:helix-turn-helix domain-containing protein n=1 Tax=Phyllobacterium sp. 628 TaxID=2718938 RepID=UPI0016625B0A|nr:helix-turn-helix domain-containing protein [Phyllobacterium sp. 628]QND54336.1 helix-turn-helix domain-containing protein [Phyllobacterium sp. 628]